MHTHPPAIEPLETRIAPATIFVVDSSNHLLRFDSATPGTVTSVAITGLAGGANETVEGIDFRPATGELYALGINDLGATDEARIYVINRTTGVASLITGSTPISITDGTNFGFDFNPTVDRIRIVNDANENLRVNPDNGSRADSPTNDTDINPAGNLTGVAYDRDFIGGPATTLYALDAGSDELVTIGGLNSTPSPNTGTISHVGALGLDISGSSGFDIAGDHTAFAALTASGTTRLFSIALGSGGATSLGVIDTGATPIKGLAVESPAITFKLVNPKTATFLDLDGDLVTVKTSKGAFTAANFGFGVTADAVAGGAQLTKLTLGSSFTGASITIAAKKAPGGDGVANVGFIDATGTDLAAVGVKGDLGRIVAGDSTLATPALKTLSVGSMGTLGLFTQGGGGRASSFLTGKLGALKVTSDFSGAFLSVSGGSDGRIDSISIGGDVIGGDATLAGSITATGDIKTVKIAGDIIGGSAALTGSISTSTTLHSLSVGGSVIGGAGDNSANITASVLVEKITIGRDLVGGTGGSSGFIQSPQTVGSVTIGRNLVGGPGTNSANLQATILLSDVLIKGSIIGGGGIQSARLFSTTAIGTITVTGDLVGGAGNKSGSVDSGGTTAAVIIGGSMRGGSGPKSGSILTTGALGKVTIARDVFGGSNSESGEIQSDLSIANVQIAGSLVGGVGGDTGTIKSLGTIGDVLIKGSLIGGPAFVSGVIMSGGDMGNVRIDGDLIGGSIGGTTNAQNTGAIESGGRIASVTLGGSLIAGLDASTSDLRNSGAIIAADDLGPVKIAGSILGNSSNTALITAGGQHVKPTSGFDVAIASVTVGRSVEYGQILAGVDSAGASINADASIGIVTVNGHWTASDIAAGIEFPGANGYGVNNTLGAIGNTSLIARIASVTIKGYVSGSTATGDNFGFVAQQIDSLKIGANTLMLTAGSSNDFRALPFTNDVHVFEV